MFDVWGEEPAVQTQQQECWPFLLHNFKTEICKLESVRQQF